MEEVDQNSEENSIIIAIIGQDGAGKSSILKQYTEKEFDDTSYTPTYYDLIKQEYPEGIKMEIFDTAYLDDGYRFIGLMMHYSQYFVFCFDVSKHGYSLSQMEWWHKMICKDERHSKKPLLFVATKIDLRDSALDKSQFLSKEELEGIARSFGAFDLIECSSKNNHNIEIIFDKIVQHHKLPYCNYPKQKKDKCSVM